MGSLVGVLPRPPLVSLSLSPVRGARLSAARRSVGDTGVRRASHRVGSCPLLLALLHQCFVQRGSSRGLLGVASHLGGAVGSFLHIGAVPERGCAAVMRSVGAGFGMWAEGIAVLVGKPSRECVGWLKEKEKLQPRIWECVLAWYALRAGSGEDVMPYTCLKRRGRSPLA